MSGKLIVLHVTEDGPSIKEMTDKEFNKAIEDGYFGNRPDFDSALPVDLMSYQGTVLIRGKVVVPEPVTSVTKYRLPD